MLIGCVSGMPSRCMRSSTASATGNLKTLIIGNRVSLRAIVSPPGVRTATPTKALCSDTISSSRDSNCRVAVSQDAVRTDRHRSRSFFISWQRIKKHTFSGCAFFRIFPCCLSFDDRLAGANACAGAAVDALIGIDHIDIAGRDRFGRALADAGAAGNAGISDFVSHFC